MSSTINVFVHNTSSTSRDVGVDKVTNTVALNTDNGGIARIAERVAIMFRYLAEFQSGLALSAF